MKKQKHKKKTKKKKKNNLKIHNSTTNNTTNNKKSIFSMPLFRVLGLIVLLLSILIYVESRNKQEIVTNGIDSIGVVENCENFSYRENARSNMGVSYYRIKVTYEFNGKQYLSTIELQENEYYDKIGVHLFQGDKVVIRHSTSNPNNVIIKGLHEQKPRLTPLEIKFQKLLNSNK